MFAKQSSKNYFKNLPESIKSKIYEYDNTYKEIYSKCLKDMFVIFVLLDKKKYVCRSDKWYCDNKNYGNKYWICLD